jgi:hypothetical protein
LLIRWQRRRSTAACYKEEHSCANGEADDEGKNEVHQAMVLKG